MIYNFLNKVNKNQGSFYMLCAHGKGGAITTPFYFFLSPLAKNFFRAKPKRAGKKERGLGEGIFARPPFLGGGWVCGCRRRRTSQSEFCSKKVRASFSNCDQMQLLSFLGEFVCSLASPSARLASQISLF